MRPRTTAADWGDDSSLGSAAARGALTSAVTTWMRFAMQLVTMVLVARIIGPSQYGAAATALVAVTAAEMVRSGGVTWLVSRLPDLTPTTTATLHRLSIVVGSAVAGAFAVATIVVPATVLPAGIWTFPMLAVVFVAAGLGAVPTALLARNLRFRPIGGAEVLAALCSCSAGVLSALHGLGAAALLLQAVVYATVLCVAVLLVTPWRPGRSAPLRTVRSELGFAGSATVSQGLEWAVRSFDRLVVAALFGTAAAGFYVQAAQLVTLPTEQVNGPLRRVAVPALGRLVDDPERFRATHRTVLQLSCIVLWPVLAVLAVLATPIVTTLFGTGWEATAPVFRAMVPMGMATVVTGVTTFAALAHGLATRQTVWECAVARPATVLGFVIGSAWGTVGVAAGVSVATVAMVLPGFLVVVTRAGLSVRDLLVPLVEPALTAVVCSLAAWLVAAQLDVGALQTSSAAGGTAAVLWLLAVFALPRTRRSTMRLARSLRTRRGTTTRTATADQAR